MYSFGNYRKMGKDNSQYYASDNYLEMYHNYETNTVDGLFENGLKQTYIDHLQPKKLPLQDDSKLYRTVMQGYMAQYAKVKSNMEEMSINLEKSTREYTILAENVKMVKVELEIIEQNLWDDLCEYDDSVSIEDEPDIRLRSFLIDELDKNEFVLGRFGKDAIDENELSEHALDAINQVTRKQYELDKSGNASDASNEGEFHSDDLAEGELNQDQTCKTCDFTVSSSVESQHHLLPPYLVECHECTSLLSKQAAFEDIISTVGMRELNITRAVLDAVASARNIKPDERQLAVDLGYELVNIDEL